MIFLILKTFSFAIVASLIRMSDFWIKPCKIFDFAWARKSAEILKNQRFLGVRNCFAISKIFNFDIEGNCQNP